MLRKSALTLQKGVSDSHRYCLNHVKKYDRENYLAALCVEDIKLRRAIVALRAFNVELSLVRDLTTSAERARVRFHFWSKLIDEISARQSENHEPSEEKLSAYYNYSPVARELLELFQNIKLVHSGRQWLHDLIGARVSTKASEYKPFESLEELELYCSKSNSSIYHLSFMAAGQILDLPEDKLISSVSNSLGIAQGLSNVIRGIPHNSRKNCCYVPQDILEEHHLSWRDFARPNLDQARISPVVEALAQRCQVLIDSACGSYQHLPNSSRNLTLSRVSIQSYLKKLRKYNYNVCDDRLLQRNQLLPLNLWLASRFIKAPIL